MYFVYQPKLITPMTPLFFLAGDVWPLWRTSIRSYMMSIGHIGTKKTLAEVGKLFDCVPRSAFDKYVALCFVCHMRKPQTTRAPLKPIVSSGFMTKGQIDLIDMRHRPDGTYKWIRHYMDHWSKIHVLFPLCRKSAAEVGLNLQTHVFSYLGTPKILHSDNGREFVNEI